MRERKKEREKEKEREKVETDEHSLFPEGNAGTEQS